MTLSAEEQSFEEYWTQTHEYGWPTGTHEGRAVKEVARQTWLAHAEAQAAEVKALRGLLKDVADTEPFYSDDQTAYCFWCSGETPREAPAFDTDSIRHDADCLWGQIRAALAGEGA